jgi:hypothetical protein
VPLTQQRLTPEQIKQICTQLIPHQKDRERLDEITTTTVRGARPALVVFV